MPEGVIDLTAEDEGDDQLHAPTTIVQPQRRALPIDLTDESDDIEYIGVNRIHLPARPYATGNDPRQPHFNRNVDIANPNNAQPGRRRAILNNFVREAEAREGIFSRDAGNNGGPGPAAEAFAAGARWQQQQPRRVQGHVPPPRADPQDQARFQGIFNDVREYDLAGFDEVHAGVAGGLGNHHLNNNNNRAGGARGFLNQWFRGAFNFFGGGGGGGIAYPGMPAFNGGQPYVPIPHDAEAKRRKKTYSVRQSHPGFTKANSKGFSRDVVPPPEYEPEPEAEVEPEVLAKEEETKQEEIQPTISSSRKGKQKMQVFDISESPSGSGSAKREIDEEETDEDKPLMSLISKTSPKRLDKGKQKAVDQDNLDNPEIPVFDLDSPSNSSSATSTQNSLDKPASSSTSSTSIELLPSAPASKPISSIPMTTIGSSSSSIEMVQPIRAPSPPKIKTRTVPCPVCASCAQPLYLNQPSKKRPYLLFCQHVVCHTCLMTATKRCEEWSKRKKEGGWTGTPVEEFEELEPGIIPVPNYGSKTKKAAADSGKGKRTREDDDDEEDLAIPAGKKQPKTRKGATVKTRTSRSKRAAAAVANARDFAESSGEEDIAVPDDPSYRPPETDGEVQYTPSQEGQENDDDDEMNDGPRQPGTSHIITSSPDKKALNVKKAAKAKRLAAARKKKSDAAGEIVVDENWLVCPIEACKGHKTDLLQPIGSKTGAWEMFV